MSTSRLPRTTYKEALAEMEAAGLRYTGAPLPLFVRRQLRLPTVCVVCGVPRISDLKRIREGHTCKHLTATKQRALTEIEKAGLRYTGDGLPPVVYAQRTFPAECSTCGSPRTINLNRIRSGFECKHLRVAADIAEKWAAERGWKPREPYPCSRRVPWRLACTVCSRPAVHRLDEVLQPGTVCPCGKRVAEMREAGYEPKVPFPGTARKPWASTCITCGADRSPNLTTIRSGARCQHTGTPFFPGPGTS